jgi:hypothetical protein
MSEMIARGLAERLAKHRGQSTGARTGAARISNTSLAQQWGHQDNFAAVPKSRSAGVEMPRSPSASAAGYPGIGGIAALHLVPFATMITVRT